MTQSPVHPITHSPHPPGLRLRRHRSDESRMLENERARWQGIRHEQRIEPADPKPGQPVTLTMTVGPDARVAQMAAYVTVDGSQPAGSRGVTTVGCAVPLHRVETRWENVIWDYVEVWQGTIPGQADGTLVQYRIEGWGEDFNAETQRNAEGGEEDFNAETQRSKGAEKKGGFTAEAQRNAEGGEEDFNAETQRSKGAGKKQREVAEGETQYVVRNTQSVWSDPS